MIPRFLAVSDWENCHELTKKLNEAESWERSAELSSVLATLSLTWQLEMSVDSCRSSSEAPARCWS